MLQIVPRWQVDIGLSNGQAKQIWIADNFIENVLRQVASITFTDNPLVRVESVRIAAQELPQQSVSVSGEPETGQ